MELPKTYYGGKNGSGVYQTIINQIPPHKRYIELFLGNGAILRLKRAAMINIAVEKDKKLVDQFSKKYRGVHFFLGCGIEFIEDYNMKMYLRKETFIYCDPPYLIETRSTPKKQYKFELTRADHIRFLKAAVNLKCMVMISCYDNELYSEMLPGWRKIHFKAKTRRGMATETLYMNYPEPTELHDYSFLGKNFRDRYRITKKIQRHVQGLKRLPILERNAIIQAIQNNI